MIDTEAHGNHPRRSALGCANQAHGFAACGPDVKIALRRTEPAQLGIVTAYNDMLSAHQPFESYPSIIRDAARTLGAVAQVAGGVPAMCDGITQGYPGMELTLFSRDRVTTAQAPAPSTEPLTRTSSWSRLWACTCPAQPSCLRTAGCVLP
jgi:phosphogluconate dehydratase